jgi:hypothetical protein
MARKSIAAFLLVVIAAWAEMTMAPMFAMHAGHMRPGHEMAADMPPQHAGHNHAGHGQKMAEGRPCCPQLHKAEPVAMLEMVSGSPACDDPHSCCFRQGPQSMPAPARDVQRLAREMAPAVAVEINPERGTARRAVDDSLLALRPPPDVFGMTLRI